ncbi:MAG: DUF2326 domain-containing protein [Verrucomicrobia bacterium]|nr:DUF2326 domain-containing protein [Verrucomicrobiota bacterium]
MKLSRLYCNKPTLFKPVLFNEGLNVVLARVRFPKDPEKLSHCLGKSLIIEVIDFGLLCSAHSSHFLKTQLDRFQDFVFYLEVRTPMNSFITVKRSVKEPTKISFKKHTEPNQDFTEMADDGWDHVRAPFKKARILMDGFLGLTAIKSWSYRKGVTYFLRTQKDYNDVFQLAKFGHGQHMEWKPYLADVVGLEGSLLTKKYIADSKIEEYTDKQKELQSGVTVRPADFEKLKASIAVKRDEVNRKADAIDSFDFHTQEVLLTSELAEQIEAEIAETNNLLYNAKHDLAQIERGLQDEVHFDLSDVRRVFEESSLTFPEQLARDYSDLVEFNRRILAERREHLQGRAVVLQSEIQQLDQAGKELSERRRVLLQVLGGTDSLKKFKDLQRELDTGRASLALLEEKEQRLAEVMALNDDLRQAKAVREELKGRIEAMVAAARNPVSRYQTISLNFSRIISDVLHRTALFYVKLNEKGNLDFMAEFTDSATESPTEEHRGNTFKQVLCIAFDLAVLTAYADVPFFHFVYHDGVLEQKQSKMKLALLHVIRTTCEQYHIQYIMSTLEEDLPTAEDTSGLCPKPEEIILELDDSGDDGRLFKGGRF